LFVLSEGDLPYSGRTQRPTFRAQRPAVEAVGTSVPSRTWYEAKEFRYTTLREVLTVRPFLNNMRFFRNRYAKQNAFMDEFFFVVNFRVFVF
jgi:hypothetical protein